MNYIGKWKLHSVRLIDDNNEAYFVGPEEYISSPMPYVDENDPEAVADEIRERRMLAGSKIEICEGGNALMLSPLPEGISDEEVQAAVAAGEISLHDGMITGGSFSWEITDGELWCDMGYGDKTKVIDEDGMFNFMTFRYVKE